MLFHFVSKRTKTKIDAFEELLTVDEKKALVSFLRSLSGRAREGPWRGPVHAAHA